MKLFRGYFLAVVVIFYLGAFTPLQGAPARIYNVQFNPSLAKKAPLLSFQSTGLKNTTIQIYINGVYGGSSFALYSGQKHHIKLPKANWKGLASQKVTFSYVTSPGPGKIGQAKQITFTVNKTWFLPQSRANTRFFKDLISLPRPALTLRGFDNTKMGKFSNQYNTKALGVRQVLERAYGINGVKKDPLVARVYQKIIYRSRGKLKAYDPKKTWPTTYNNEVLQGLAFLAVATYIRDRNHILQGIPKSRHFNHEPSHQKVRDRLVSILTGSLVKNRHLIAPYPWGDAVKKSRTMMMLARSIDFYLALENAYQDLGGPTSKLLNYSEKKNLMKMLAKDMNDVDGDVTKGWFGINLHEVQPGNWPMKPFAALGYASLTLQGPKGKNYYNPYLHQALKGALFNKYTTGNTRMNYWYYQTSQGKRVWAEGSYYFRWSLQDIVPFWHAIRANNLLNYGPHGPGVDPFYHPGFLNVIEWLADISTPEGSNPPVDDGNKSKIMVSSLLRWDSSYGKKRVGDKFARINEKLGGPGRLNFLLPVEIAIPRTTVNGKTHRIPRDIGNTSPKVHREQQLVLRRSFQQKGKKNTHYVLMHGETHNAIERGEGHEQPDPMQILYYVNGTSYLVDSGYDRPGFKWPRWVKSTWSNFKDHNVMFMDYKYGGIEPPRLSLWKKRVVSGQRETKYLFREKKGKVTVFQAMIPLQVGFNWALYTRQVIFVEDDQNPYLIDLNRIRQLLGNRDGYGMRYHGNSNSFIHNSAQPSSQSEWDVWKVSSNPKKQKNHSKDPYDLYMYFRSADYGYQGKAKVHVQKNFKIDEYFRAQTPISRVTMKKPRSSKQRYFSTMALFRVSDQAPTYNPQPLSTLLKNKKVAGWVIRSDNGQTIDVLVMRSAGHMGSKGKKTVFNVPQIGNRQLTLPASRDFALFRFRLAGGTPSSGSWKADNRFQYVGTTGQTLSSNRKRGGGGSGGSGAGKKPRKKKSP